MKKTIANTLLLLAVISTLSMATGCATDGYDHSGHDHDRTGHGYHQH